jgi:hypothetical protein
MSDGAPVDPSACDVVRLCDPEIGLMADPRVGLVTEVKNDGEGVGGNVDGSLGFCVAYTAQGS